MRFVIAALALLLAACSQPKTQLPPVDDAALEAERQYQETFAYKQDFSYLYDIPLTKKPLQERLLRIASKIGPAAIKLCDDLRLTDASGQKRRCLFDVHLAPATYLEFNAYADGDMVVVGRRLMHLVRSDDQLAFIIAHEFAHNIMNHLDDQVNNMAGGLFLGTILDETLSAGTGISTGGDFRRLGGDMGSVSYSPAYEYEADYVGLYILARAGYALEKAPDVWRLMAALSSQKPPIVKTHPTSPERFVMMKKIIEEIAEKRKNKQALLPEMRKDIE